MGKQSVVYPYSGILFTLRKKEMVTHATVWMKLEDFMQSEISGHKRTNIALVLVTSFVPYSL